MRLLSSLALRVLLVIVCLAHLTIGIGVNVSSEFPKAAAGWYGATLETWSPEFLYILRPIGAYMIVMGLLAAAAALRPGKYGLVIYGLGLLMILRAVQRIVCHSDIVETFGIDATRNIVNTCFFAALGVALIGLRGFAGRRATTGE